jgi:hypothetical protein
MTLRCYLDVRQILTVFLLSKTVEITLTLYHSNV